MYPVTPVYAAVGEKLVVPANQATTFALANYVNNLIGLSTYEYTFDWGDGDIQSGVYTAATSTTSHTWRSPGKYRVQLQTVIAGALQTFSWEVEVVWSRSALSGTQPVPWVAALHGSLHGAGNEWRHIVLPLPGYSNPVDTPNETGLAIGEWTTAAAVVLDITELGLSIAVDNALTRFQAAFANGFGRMAQPSRRQEPGVWLHFSLDSLPAGTSTDLLAGLANLETVWREMSAQSGPSSWMPLIKDAVDSIFTAAAATTLPGLAAQAWDVANDGSGAVRWFGAGDRSVRMAEVMRWIEYRERELNDNQTAADVPVWGWRRQTAQGAGHAPEPHADAAWAWEVSQAALQAAASFYQSLGSMAQISGASLLVTANPASGQVSLRIDDPSNKLWAVLQVGPAGDAGSELRPTDLVMESGPGGSGFVVARGIAMGSALAVTGTAPPNSWDVARAYQAFKTADQSDYPTYNAVSPSEALTVSIQVGLPLSIWLLPDGTTRSAALVRASATTADNWVIADVNRRAIPLPDAATMRSGLRPHALLAEVVARGRQRGTGRSSAGLATTADVGVRLDLRGK